MSASTTNEPYRPGERLKENVADAGLAAAAGLRAAEIALVVLVGLLVCPPLAILAVVVVAPMLAAVLVLLLVSAVLSVPYLLVHGVAAASRLVDITSVIARLKERAALWAPSPRAPAILAVAWSQSRHRHDFATTPRPHAPRRADPTATG